MSEESSLLLLLPFKFPFKTSAVPNIVAFGVAGSLQELMRPFCFVVRGLGLEGTSPLMGLGLVLGLTPLRLVGGPLESISSVAGDLVRLLSGLDTWAGVEDDLTLSCGDFICWVRDFCFVLSTVIPLVVVIRLLLRTGIRGLLLGVGILEEETGSFLF